jgi:outer membrane protein assembly factor BamB
VSKARVGLFVAGGMFLAGCAMFGGDDDDPIEPPAELVEFEPSIEVREVWSVDVGGSAELLRLGLGPATDGSFIYAGSHDGQVGAYNVETGRRNWQVRLELPLAAGPGYGGGVLAFGTNDGDLVTLDASTGQERWRRQIGGEVLASPAIGRDVIVVRSVDGRLRGFSVLDGRELWSVEHPVPALTLRGTTTPVVAGDMVVAGFDNGRLGVYELASGDTLWEAPMAAPSGRSELERLVDISAGLAVVGGQIFAVGYNSRAIGVTLDTGQLMWEQELSSYAGLGAGFNGVYVADEFSAIVALDRARGTELWRQSALRLRDVTAPTYYRGTVVVGDLEGYLHWLSADNGEFLARERMAQQRISSAPLVVGEQIVAQADDGRLAAYTIVAPETDADD